MTFDFAALGAQVVANPLKTMAFCFFTGVAKDCAIIEIASNKLTTIPFQNNYSAKRKIAAGLLGSDVFISLVAGAVFNCSVDPFAVGFVLGTGVIAFTKLSSSNEVFDIV